MLNLPKHIYISGYDMNELDNNEVSDMIEENFAFWSELKKTEQENIASWWADESGQYADEFFDDSEIPVLAERITDSQLVQYITEDGYKIK